VCRRLQHLVEAHSGGAESPNCQLARHISGGRNPLDILSRDFRQEVTRKAKDELEIQAFRNRAKGGGRGGAAAPAVVADAVAAGGLPDAGAAVAPRGRGRGRDGRGGGRRSAALVAPGATND
jgi:hypothetical protein